MKRAFVIINPVAGKGIIKQKLFALVEALSRKDYLATVYLTKSCGDGLTASAALQQADLIVASGGDGTLREVVSGCMLNETLKAPILYLPAGTTNDFAHTLNLAKNFEKNLLLLDSEQLLAIDIGQFNEQYFVYVAAFGAFTEVSYRTPQVYKNIFGHLAYVLGGITQLSQIKGYKCRIQADECRLEGEFLFGCVLNSDSIGGIKRRLGPKSQLSDGFFEVAFVSKPAQLQDIPKLIAQLLSGESDNEQIVIMQAQKVTVEADEAISWTLDGENGGVHQKAVIANMVQALSLIVPHGEGR